ncbi:helix-turn-helix protein [Lutibacter oceani]|jgi:AraC-like DNA-binding protein|uniref:Helix-turn-helix protein n=2 Tax=Lutibacter TaxID=358023 RepID=A0A3D9RRZ9_9FLAO|nr:MULTISPECIES: AraC family transcriptional regulator [Lutibacter]NLP59032.1 helix-turn-helix transcriptional regulator [Lutibacter sp. B1]REE80284.1 helix-turn-helix protein [Lutibacter oceani]SNR68882.1 Helix-turn-helix domain-containing protein [Lutibacter flavus]
MEQKNIVTVKNMVCDRCIKVIKDELIKNNIMFELIELGKIHFEINLSTNELKTLKTILEKEGFEIVEESDLKIVNQIKTLIIENIFHKRHKLFNENYSTFLSSNLKIEYGQLSRIFSELEKRTIENYIIQQKIERVKELIFYNELTISQISYELNYSSPQHLSRQFKKITGITPTQYKNIGSRGKLDTI